MFNKKTLEMLSKPMPSLPMVIGEASLKHDLDDLIKMALPQMRLAVIDDINTSAALGSKIAAATKGQHLTLSANIEADDAAIEQIRSGTSKCDALIAVGSGTISDLCKYSAFLDNKPYITFPTAASMNGYLSANASITVKGHKTTLKAQLPKAVFCDFSVISSAPVRLNKSGLGDSLARPTAQADWLLSHLLLDTPYDSLPFELITDIETELFDSAQGIACNDLISIKSLTELLLLSGLGMTIAAGSYPASQGEHMIAHCYHMLKNSPAKFKTLHGEEIGVTSLYMAKLQTRILNSNRPEILISDSKDLGLYLSDFFAEHLTGEFCDEFNKKYNLVKQHHPQDRISDWDSVREKIIPVMISPEKIWDIIDKAQIPSSPKNIGWDNEAFLTSCNTARFTRNRFTFLDLLPK